MKKIIGLILILFLISGCSKENNFDKISEAIINFHTDINYDISELDEEDIKILNDFKEQEKRENKEINLSKLDMFNDYFKVNEDDSENVYTKDESYYIKYNDIPFKYDNGNYYAIVVAGGYGLELNRNDYPILYEDTNNANYKYKFVRSDFNDNEVNYYYRSYANGSMLTINYELKDNKINEITLKYYKNFYLAEDEEKSSSNIFSILFIVSPLIILIIFSIFISRKLLKNKEV